MKRMVGAGTCLFAVLAAAACSSGSGRAVETGDEGADGVRVEAQRDVMVSEEPLGDVVRGELNPGDTATAQCFVSDAQTNAGLRGSAIRIDAGHVSGYAAVTDFPEDPAEAQMMFDLDAETLRDRLPPCPD